MWRLVEVSQTSSDEELNADFFLNYNSSIKRAPADDCFHIVTEYIIMLFYVMFSFPLSLEGGKSEG